MRKFWIIISVCWLWTCGGGGGGSSPTEPQEPAPVANFTATPTTLIQGQAVTFTSTSTGTITSYAWNVDNDPAIEGTTATYEHTYTEVGTYSITLTVTGPGGSNPKTVADMITVSTAAPTPTTSTSQTVQEDGSTTISLTATDPNGQAVTFAITTDPTNGTATLSGTDITYTPNANFYGTDSFDYTASNGTYTSDPATITITVEGEDDGDPTTNDVSATTDEDTVVTVNLDATEIDGDNYSFSIVSQPTNGTLGSVNGNQVEYTPNQDWNGTDTFTFEATDDRTFRRNVATATITVNPVNDAPVANNVTVSMNENKEFTRLMPVTITLDATDVDGDALTYFKQSDPSNGTLGTITNNQVVYTPTQDFNGEDTFIYKATDGNADSNGATVTVTVTSVNDAPVTTDQSASTDEDTAVNITLTATDVENDNLTFTIVSDVSNGTTSLSGATVTYTPDSNWNGTDTFTFKANDGTDDSNTSTVTITVNAVNDAPTTEDVSTTIDENRTASRSTGIALQGSDVDGDNLTYTVVSGPSNGDASIAGSILTYAANQDWNGTETFTYKANDGTADSNTSTVTITVNSVNDAPVTTDRAESTTEDQSLGITFTAIDVDGDDLTYSIVSDASNGTVNFVGRTGTYTPTANFNGTDTFTYKANDGTADSNTSTVTITVASVNDAPVANDVTASTTSRTGNMRQAVTITLDATDVEGDDLTISIVSDVSNGTTSLSGSTVTYTPTANYDGTDTFTYKANDGTVDSNIATGTITVENINQPPTSQSASYSIPDNYESKFELFGEDDNLNINFLTFSIVDQPSNGAISISNNIVTYNPGNFSGSELFTYKVSDGENDSTVSSISLNVINSPAEHYNNEEFLSISGQYRYELATLGEKIIVAGHTDNAIGVLDSELQILNEGIDESDYGSSIKIGGQNFIRVFNDNIITGGNHYLNPVQQSAYHEIDSSYNLVSEKSINMVVGNDVEGQGMEAMVDVTNLSDGGKALLAWSNYSPDSISIVKLNSNLSIVMAKEVVGNSDLGINLINADKGRYRIFETNDNELIILAPDWSDDAKIFKMDFSGNISWIESPGYEIVRLIKSSDGKFIALMSSGGHDPSNNDGNTRVFFYNDSGYSGEFQLNNTSDAKDIVELSNGDLVILYYYAENTDLPELTMQRVDSNGNLVWEKTYRNFKKADFGANKTRLGAIVETSDGHIVVAVDKNIIKFNSATGELFSLD